MARHVNNLAREENNEFFLRHTGKTKTRYFKNWGNSINIINDLLLLYMNNMFSR
jgi:hypothetical protein